MILYVEKDRRLIIIVILNDFFCKFKFFSFGINIKKWGKIINNSLTIKNIIGKIIFDFQINVFIYKIIS